MKTKLLVIDEPTERGKGIKPSAEMWMFHVKAERFFHEEYEDKPNLQPGQCKKVKITFEEISDD